MTETRINYQGNPIIKAIIINVQPNRVIIQMNDGRLGVIPKREWNWDQGVNKKPDTFTEGRPITAVLLPGESRTFKPLLSIRELTNPWEEIEHKYSIGQIVVGEIVSIRRFAAFIQIAPGITAVSWPKDIPMLPAQIPDDVLVLGDRVKVQIVDFNIPKRQMEVSLTVPLQQIPEVSEQQTKDLRQLFISDLKAVEASKKPGENYIKVPRPDQYFQVNPLPHLQKVLVIDDNPNDGHYACTMIKNEFNAVVETVHSGEEGIAKLKEDPTIDLVIIDMSLGDGNNGTSVARQILSFAHRTAIVFYSSNVFEEAELLQLEEEFGYVFPFVEKSSQEEVEGLVDDELISAIKNLQQGQIIKKKGIVTKTGADNQILDQFKKATFFHASLQEGLDRILRQLAKETHVENLLLLEVHSDKKTVEMVASYPDKRRALFLRSLDGLYFSPVRDVVEDEETFYVGSLDEDAKKVRISNFFPTLSFKTCYCTPIKLPDQPVRRALFILDDRPDLTWPTIARIRSAADYIAMAFERALLLKILQQADEDRSRGKLLGSFIHELHNKIQPLQGFAEDGAEIIRQNPEKTKQYVEDVASTVAQLLELTRAYGRLAKDEMEQIDLNKIVQKVYAQFLPLAKYHNIKIVLQLDEQLPESYLIALHLEQALSNVVLNAIQQINEQKKSFLNISRTHTHYKEKQLYEQGLIVITSAYSIQLQTVTLAVMDSGPGVSYDRQEAIFQPKESTRNEGQGLGLFISRNLVEAMGGRIVCAGSVRFWGSVFTLSFSVDKPGNHGQKQN